MQTPYATGLYGYYSCSITIEYSPNISYQPSRWVYTNMEQHQCMGPIEICWLAADTFLLSSWWVRMESPQREPQARLAPSGWWHLYNLRNFKIRWTCCVNLSWSSRLFRHLTRPQATKLSSGVCFMAQTPHAVCVPSAFNDVLAMH